MKARYFFFIFLFAVSSINAQKRIAIVNVADSSVVFQKRGVTIFGNSNANLSLNFSIPQYIDSTLISYLKNGGYEPNIIQYYKSDLHYRLNKETKQWISNLKDSFNLIIFIDNFDIPSEFIGANGPKNSTGIFQTNGIRKSNSYFSTIGYSAWTIPQLKSLDYYALGGKLFLPEKKLELPDKVEMLNKSDIDALSNGLKKYLDYRIRYFLVKSYILPNLSSEID